MNLYDIRGRGRALSYGVKAVKTAVKPTPEESLGYTERGENERRARQCKKRHKSVRESLKEITYIT
jgi:hypothetical protein